MATTDLHASRMQQTIHRMLVRKVDGVALLAAEIETKPIETMIHNRVPLVTLDRRLVGRGLSDVAVHYLSGMSQALVHLKELGHRKIAYIGGSPGPTISDHRTEAFSKAMGAGGLRVDPKLVRAGNYRIAGGEAAMMELLSLKERPTAIMAANDLTAIGALRVIRREGLSVPQDFSIVGFDDIELSDVVFPPLTTIRLPRHQLAEMFVNALDLAQEDRHSSGKQFSIKTSLVIRDSTGVARKRKQG